MKKGVLKKIVFFVLLIITLLFLYFSNPLVDAPKDFMAFLLYLQIIHSWT